MSAQAGILYADCRPISEAILDALAADNLVLAPDGVSRYVADGVALLSFAWHFDALSLRERQPCQSADGAILTFDGRLDNRDDLLVRLRERRVDEDTDADLVSHACVRWGDDAWQNLVGDWSVARWDPRTRELTLASDYTGNRAPYFCAQPGRFVWSTALEPLVDLCGLAGQTCDEFFAARLSHGATGHLTPYRDAFVVPAGHVVRVRPGASPTCQPWLQFRGSTLRYGDRRQYDEQYRELLTQAVKVRLRARAPVWPELSGGYDSSSITCLANQLVRAGTVETPRLQPISWLMGDAPESDENTYITCVEQHCQLRTRRRVLTGTYKLPSLTAPRVSRDPNEEGGPGAALVAHEGSHVVLSGEFGDVLTDSGHVRAVLRDHLRARRWHAALSDSVEHCRVTRSSLLTLWRDAVRSWLAANRESRSRPATSAAPVAVGLSSEPSQQPVLGREGLRPVRASAFRLNIGDARHPILQGLADFAETHILDSIKEGLYPVRVSYPFTHRPLVDFVRALPPVVTWRADQVRPLVCGALRDVLPPEILARQTKGYAEPAGRRLVIPALMEELEHGRIERWQLVRRGYIESTALITMARAVLDGTMTVPISILTLMRVESLLRGPRLRITSTSED